MELNNKVIHFLILTGSTIMFSLVKTNSTVSKGNIITMRDGRVKSSDLYLEENKFPSLPQSTLLQNLTFNKILSKEISGKVLS
ncbi:hypothetical protein [Lactococcus lactis]|uniref:hypothetical protein n=1 Tax=Lactococcus lactis TaxID=1358 RepID=UPI0032E40EDF